MNSKLIAKFQRQILRAAVGRPLHAMRPVRVRSFGELNPSQTHRSRHAVIGVGIPRRFFVRDQIRLVHNHRRQVAKHIRHLITVMRSVFRALGPPCEQIAPSARLPAAERLRQ